MRTFVISRMQDVARRAAICAQLQSLGLAYELVAAVDGRGLSAEEKRALADFPKMRRVLRILSDGEIGCAASHNVVYRKMVAEDIGCACVLEDDARVRVDGQALAACAHELGDAQDEPRVRLLTDRGQGAVWTIGYVINQKAARVMLKYNDPIWRVADCWESLMRRGRIRVDWTETAYVEPNVVLGSVITPEGTPPHRVPLPGDVWSVTWRIFWRLVYRIGLKV